MTKFYVDILTQIKIPTFANQIHSSPKQMRKLTLAILATFIGFTAFSQSFEGTIEFKRLLPNDTAVYIYHVKGQKVRIDEMAEDGKTVEGSMIVNLADKKMYALSHDRKLYMERPYKADNSGKMNLELEKSTNSKFINGYKCTQWRVKNKDKDSEITYWVAEGKFDFFLPLLNVINRRDNFATFYTQLPESVGFFPMLAVERNFLRDEKGRLQVTKVNAHNLDNSFLEIPKEYKKVDK